MLSILLLPTLFYFSQLIRAAAAAPPALTDTPQLLQLPSLQQPKTATVSSPNTTSSNPFFIWHVPDTSYNIYIVAYAPFRPTLPIVPLDELYMLAINQCHGKIAQGLGGYSPESVIFTAQDVQLEWVATTDIRLFNYTTLLRVFETLMELNVRQRSPLPELFGKDLSFEVIHDTERFYTGNGRVKKIPEAGDEILAKKSVNTSPAPQLLQPPASRQFNITTSLISNTTVPNIFYDYPIPSTPYILVISTYSLWHLLPLESLEEVYDAVLTDCRYNIAQGHGGIKPPTYNVYQRPVSLVWHQQLTGGGLNFSMLSIILETLQQLHTIPGPPLRNVYRKNIYYDVFEQRGTQRFEVGYGQVENLEHVSKRQSVNLLYDIYEYKIPSTPYKLLIIANLNYVLPFYPLQETYKIAISVLEYQIAEGRGAYRPDSFNSRDFVVTLKWARSGKGIGLDYTGLLRVVETLESIHMNRSTPWYSRIIRYHVVTSNAGQGLVAMGGGWVYDVLEMGPSNVSVQNSKRHLVNPVNPSLPSYVYCLPNTSYVLYIYAIYPVLVPKLPLDSLLIVYDMAFRHFTSEIASGHGGAVPRTVDIGHWPATLWWIREDPPGLNYSTLLSVYQLLDVFQTVKESSFQEGYRKSLDFFVATTSGDKIGKGGVSDVRH